MNTENIVVINPQTADLYDGRCFLDLDMFGERIEAFRFTKTPTGLDILMVGCDDHWGYTHNYHDDFGKYDWEDCYCGAEISMIENNDYLIKEITAAEFDEVNRIVNSQIKLQHKLEKDFNVIKHKLSFYPEERKN